MSTDKKTKKAIQSSSSSSSTTTDSKEENFKSWLTGLYTHLLSDDEVKGFYETIKFIGFNREEVLEQLSKVVKEPNIVSEIIITIAVRGPVVANGLRLSNGRTISSYGIIANGGRRNKLLTCGKIAAATADLAAYYLKKLKFPKRMNKLSCPGWLQFPSAGAIELPENLRMEHLEFAREFSKLIDKRPDGGFNEQIYEQMSSNAYCDPVIKVDLFTSSQ